jgi:hypothetical protein
MAFVGQTADPWDVPVKQSVLVMQKIWDATSTYEYEITASTTVYNKVRDHLAIRLNNYRDKFQTIQRLADLWRSAIGSTGIAVVLAFCDSQEDLESSDEERVEFANYYLKDLRFLYKDADDDNKKVCHADLVIVHVSDDSQKWRGLFRGPFVLQTFAAHLSAIEGSVCVPNLHDKPSPNAVGALGLAAASVRAFYHVWRIFLIMDRWSGL